MSPSSSRTAAIAVLATLAAAPAEAVPPAPLPGAGIVPGTGPATTLAVACPLHWHPGEPVAVHPHPTDGGSAAPGPGSGPAIARGWVEVGRPAEALAALEGVPEGPEVRLYRLAALAGLGRWRALDEALARIPAGALPAGCSALRDRWEATAAAAAGDPARADRAWSRLAGAVPGLGGYVALWRLESAATVGDRARGEAAWREVAAAGLPAAAVREAREHLARLHARTGQPDRARAAFAALAAESRGPERAELLLAAAREADRAGDRRGADGLRARVLAEEPASGAEIVLDPDLRARLGVSGVAAARILLAADRPAEAERFASEAIGPGAGAAEREARLLRAEARAGLGDRAGAEADYAAFLSRWPSDARVPGALFDRARLALRDGDGATARRRFENLAARFPGDERADDALYLTADSYQDDRRRDPAFADSAIAAFDRLVRTRPGSWFADRAYMRAAHLAWALGRWPEAERRYAGYGGRTSAREARYWLARTLERRGEDERARSILRSLAGGDDYYAILSRARLGTGPPPPFFGVGRGAAPADPFRPLGSVLLEDPAGRTAAALLAFGERALAGAELERAVSGIGRDRSRLAAWGPALVAWGFPGLALQVGVRLGRESHPLAWPKGYADAVAAEARAHGLEAAWLHALVRQESLYRADAVSVAGARGLMQILPETGRAIALAAGWASFDEDALFDPAVSLHLGSRYLADHLARYDGFWPATLAAYNGGPDAVTVWWDFPERTLDPELWVDRIPYRETRDYVKRIVAHHARYREDRGAAR